MGSIKITGAGKDIDGDKQEDVFMAWSEVPLQPSGSFHAAYLTPTGTRNEVKLPPLKYQGNVSEVADVHLGASFSRPQKKEEFIIILSGLHNLKTTGFGVMSLTDELKLEAGIWGPGLPTTIWSGLLPNLSSSCYGKFGIMPGVGTPLVHVAAGPGIIFMPWVEAPFVANEGEILDSKPNSRYLAECTADYDGDGVDEVVLVDAPGNLLASWMYVGDPTTYRTWAQAFDLRQTMPKQYGRFELYHGVNGDFNGDGKLDVLISYSAGGKGFFTLFVGDPKAGPGEPPLRRAY